MAGAVGPGTHGLTFRLEIPGAQPLAFALSRFAHEIQDFVPFWEGPFKTLWFASRKQAFALGGEPGGRLWAPLSDRYRQWKHRHYPGAGPLVQSGRMKASITTPDAYGSIWRPGRQSLELGSYVRSRGLYPYPVAHQHGTRRMPARLPLALSPGMAGAIAKDLQRHVVQAWVKRRRAERVLNPS